MNTFRVQRGDPRARSEEELGALREQMGTKWWEEIQGYLRDVQIAQTCLWGEELRREQLRREELRREERKLRESLGWSKNNFIGQHSLLGSTHIRLP